MPKKELNQLYLSLALRYFALSLLGLFVPLYLYRELGFSLAETLGFYAGYSLVLAATSPLAAVLASRLGVKQVVLGSIPLYIFFLVLLYLLPTVKISLVILAVVVGFSLALYWMGIHQIFYQASDHQHRGEEIGKVKGFSILATLLGPLVGGFLITYTSFGWVFVLAGIILLLSAGVLFGSKEKYSQYHFSFSALFDRKHWRNSLFFASQGSRIIAEGVLWPLFIFSILGSYLSLGLLGFVISLVSALLVWLVGKYSDKVGKRKIIAWVTGIESFSWFLRALVKTTSQVFGVTILGAIAWGTLESPLGALEYDKVSRKSVMAYFVSREIFITVGRLLVIAVVLLTDSLTGGLLFQGVASLAAWLF